MERPHRPRPARAGFTLVELLIAILIIAALLALLVPTVAAAFRKAKEASVTAEMNNLATALASFKNTYGDYPPSRIILPENGFSSITTAGTAIVGSGSTDSDILDSQLVQRSQLYLRRFWPRVNFTTPPQGQFFDFNGNGTNEGLTGGYIQLNGSECLAFFLGGLPLHGTDPNSGLVVVTGMSGFGKLPTNPFQNSTLATNRTVPNYEFVTGRLVDLDGDGIPSYLDPLDVTQGNRRAYAYFSAYGVNGYDPNDVNGYDHRTASALDYEYEDDGTTPVERAFVVNFPVYKSGTSTLASYAASVAPNPYTTGQPAVGSAAYLNPNSYQILCAGADRLWGLGGTYLPNGLPDKLPIQPAGTGTGQDPGNLHSDDTTGVRQHENDNLANFSNGRLN